MSVYKELGYLAKQIKNNSEILFCDAADFGMPIYTLRDAILDDVKSKIQVYDSKVETYRYSTGATQKIIFDCGIGCYAETGFERVEIQFVKLQQPYKGKLHRGMIGYLEVSTSTSEACKLNYKKYANYEA